jgi:hypothetical protein
MHADDAMKRRMEKLKADERLKALKAAEPKKVEPPKVNDGSDEFVRATEPTSVTATN